MKRICIALLIALAATSHAAAQEPDPDSLVALFVEHGLAPGTWPPGYAFQGCTSLEPWQQEAFRLLTEATLTQRRQNDLALALARPFAICGNAELEAWYFAEMERLSGDGDDLPYGFWDGIRRADNPRVRAKLYAWMTDDDFAVEFRNRAAAEYFLKLEEEEKLAAFAAEYERGTLPGYHAGWMIQRLVEERPEPTLTEMGRLVREQPDRFLNDPVFRLLFSARTLRAASPAAQAAFLRDVRAAVSAASGFTAERREQLRDVLTKLERVDGQPR